MQELPNWIVALISAMLGFLASIVGTIVLDQRRDRNIRKAVKESLILELEAARKTLAGIIKEKRKDIQIVSQLTSGSPYFHLLPLVDSFFTTLNSEIAIRALKPEELRIVRSTYADIRRFNDTVEKHYESYMNLNLELMGRLVKQVRKCLKAL